MTQPTVSDAGSVPTPNTPYGSLGARMVASVIDLVIVILLDWPVWYALGGRTDGWAQLALQLLPAAYFILACTRVGQGQTVGKHLMRLRVVNRNGTPLTFGSAFLRWMVAVAAAFPLWWLWPQAPDYRMLPMIGGGLLLSAVLAVLVTDTIMLLAFVPSRRTLHDLFAGSVVVRAGATYTPPLPSPPRSMLLAASVTAAATMALAFPRYARILVLAPRTAELMDASVRMRATGVARRVTAIATFDATGTDTVWRVTALAAMRAPRPADDAEAVHRVACALAEQAPHAVRDAEVAVVASFPGSAMVPVALLFVPADLSASACVARSTDEDAPAGALAPTTPDTPATAPTKRARKAP